MFGQNTATNNSGFSFGTSQAAAPTTTFGFGTSQPAATTTPASNFSFGTSQPAATGTTNTLFGAAPAFGSQAATSLSSAPTNTLFGANTNNTNPTFGSAAPATTTSAPASTISFGANSNTTNTTNTLFGGNTSTNTTGTTNTLFGGNTSGTTNTLFGGNNSTNTSGTTNTLFGGAANSNVATVPTSSIFGGNTSTTNPSSTTFGSQTNTTDSSQKQQQQQHFLDIQNCFPDTYMSSYIVKPDSVTRSTDLVNQLFGGNASRSFTQQQKALKTTPRESLPYNENTVVLPLFLTSSDPNHSVIASNKSNSNSLLGKKRLLEENTPVTGREKSHKGVFGESDKLTDGFNKNLERLEQANHVPKESVNDIGLNITPFKEKDNKYASNNTEEQVSTQQGNGLNANTRVRVFGFNPSKTGDVIRVFSEIGELVEPYSSKGNWITFEYVTPEAANKAISLNGMYIDRDHMVGVAWDENSKQVKVLGSGNTTDLFKINGTPAEKRETPQLNNQLKQPHQETGFLNRLREKLMGW